MGLSLFHDNYAPITIKKKNLVVYLLHSGVRVMCLFVLSNGPGSCGWSGGLKWCLEVDVGLESILVCCSEKIKGNGRVLGKNKECCRVLLSLWLVLVNWGRLGISIYLRLWLLMVMDMRTYLHEHIYKSSFGVLHYL